MIKYSILVILSVSLCACATIIQPGPDRVSVDSKPAGAKVYLDGAPVGVTPMVVTVPRSADGLFKIENPGYAPVTVQRNKVLAGWFIGNVLIGGVIGIGVDLATHNQGKYTEDPIFADLQKIDTDRKTSSVP